MKNVKVLLLAFLCSTNFLLAQEVQRAFYIYRNDGDFDVMFFDDVDSMTYSAIDVDNVEQEEFVTQEIWTADSVFRIPIHAIDSISYTTPPTIYKEGVAELNEQFEDYVVSIDSLSIIVKTGIPSKLMPVIGQKIVSTAMDEVFPNGFRGIVKDIQNNQDKIRIDCDFLPIEDAFVQYFSTRTTLLSSDMSNGAPMRRAINGDLLYYDETRDIGPWVLPLPNTILNIPQDSEIDNIRKGLNLSFDNKITVTVYPTIRIQSSFIIFPDGEVDVKFSLWEKIVTDLDYDIAGTLSYHKERFKPLGDFDIPLGGGVNFYGEMGIGISLSGTLAFKGLIESETNNYFFVKYNNKYKQGNTIKANPLKFEDLIPKVKNVNSVFGHLTGSASIYLEGGVDYGSKKLDKLGIRGECGPQIDISAPIDLPFSDIKERKTDNYWELKENKAVSIALKAGASIELSLLDGLVGLSFPFAEWTSKPLYELPFVPTFEKPLFSFDVKNNIKSVSVNVNDDVVLPLEVGAVFFDSTNKDLYYRKVYEEGKYHNKKSFTGYTINFSEMKLNRDYYVYPYLHWFGQTILAEPTEVIKLSVDAVTDDTGEVTPSQAVLNAHLTGVVDFLNDNSKMGFIYGTDEQLKEHGTFEYTTLDKDNTLRKKLYNLTGGTKYYYQAFLYVDGQYTYGEVKSFTTPFPVAISNVNVTNAIYYPNAFEYYNNKYDFKFNCSTDVVVTDNTKVIDWGYVCIGPDGEKMEISLAEFNKDKVRDSRYTYFRNEPSSTVRFQGYVLYKGDSQNCYGEVQEFTLEYPAKSSITLTNCTFEGTKEDVTYNDKTYKYQSTFKYYFSATGAYWLEVGTEEQDKENSGWKDWNNDLLRETMRPCDGENILTVNYFYNDKDFEGAFDVRLIGRDATHKEEHRTTEYVTYSHKDGHFTDCTFHSAANAPYRAVPRSNNSKEATQEPLEFIINKTFY